jgi:hypothetical protein
MSSKGASKLILIAAAWSAASADAQCSFQHETIVRARFLGCESSRYDWDASGADRAIQQGFDRAVAASTPQFREEVRRRWSEQGALPGQRAPQSAFVAVVYVDWQVYTTAKWDRDASTAVEIESQPQKFQERVRYLWRGPSDVCKDTVPGSSIDLWISLPCCDFEPGPDGCLMNMSYAEPAPEPMRQALSKALDGR